MLSYYPPSLTEPYDRKVSRGFQTYEGTSVLAIKAIMATYTWSPIMWRNGHRTKDNFISARYLAFDFENEDVTIAETTHAHCDMWHILGTTRNHQKQKGDKLPIDRFRFLLRFDRVITSLEEYEYNVRFHVKRLGADVARCDGASIYFKCTDIVSCNVGDEMMDEEVREKPIVDMTQHDARTEFAKNAYKGALSPYCIRWLLNEIPEGKRNITCHRLGCELFRCGVSYEDGVTKVLASPTFVGKALAQDFIKEIRGAILNGYKQAKRDLERKMGATEMAPKPFCDVKHRNT